MPLMSFFCPSCGQSIAVDAPAGSEARCGLCQAVIVVPAPATDDVATGVASTGAAPPLAPTTRVAPTPVRSGLAIASLVCGILGLITFCFPIVGFVGVVLGIVALVQARSQPDVYGGKGAAIAGVTTGTVSMLILFPLFIVVILDIQARQVKLQCSGNLHMIANGLNSYASDNDGRYPPDFATMVENQELWPYQFVCPATYEDGNGVMNFAFNPGNDVEESELRRCYEYLKGQTTGGDADNVLIVELPHCHDDGGHVVYADGRVAFIESYDKIEQLVEQTRANLGRAE